MADDIAIRVKNVSKNFKLPHERADSVKSLFVNPFNKNRNKFEVQHALRDISFDIKKGEFFGIVGRNGSGKSLKLRCPAQRVGQPARAAVRGHDCHAGPLRRPVSEGDAKPRGQKHGEDEDPEHRLGLAEEFAIAHPGELHQGVLAPAPPITHRAGGGQ